MAISIDKSTFLLDASINANETSIVVNFTSQATPYKIENTYIEFSANVFSGDNVYSPEFCFVTGRLIEDPSNPGYSYQVEFNRGNPTGNYAMFVWYRVFQFVNVTVQHISTTIDYFLPGQDGFSITESINAIDVTKSFPVTHIDVQSQGQNLRDFAVMTELNASTVTFSKYTNSQQVNIDCQILTSDDFSVTQYKNTDTATTPLYISTGAIDLTKEFLIVTYKGNAYDMEGLGYAKYASLDADNNRIILDNYGTWNSRVNITLYKVKVAGDNITATKVLKTMSGDMADENLVGESHKVLTFNQCLYQNIHSSNNQYEERYNDALVASIHNANAVRIRRNGLGVYNDVVISLTCVEITEPIPDDIFNYLHYIGRGVYSGVGIGIC